MLIILEKSKMENVESLVPSKPPYLRKWRIPAICFTNTPLDKTIAMKIKYIQNV